LLHIDLIWKMSQKLLKRQTHVIVGRTWSDVTWTNHILETFDCNDKLNKTSINISSRSSVQMWTNLVFITKYILLNWVSKIEYFDFWPKYYFVSSSEHKELLVKAFKADGCRWRWLSTSLLNHRTKFDWTCQEDSFTEIRSLRFSEKNIQLLLQSCRPETLTIVNIFYELSSYMDTKWQDLQEDHTELDLHFKVKCLIFCHNWQ
jgi:hypothetical protein